MRVFAWYYCFYVYILVVGAIGLGCFAFNFGGVAERLKAPVLKTGVP